MEKDKQLKIVRHDRIEQRTEIRRKERKLGEKNKQSSRFNDKGKHDEE